MRTSRIRSWLRCFGAFALATQVAFAQPATAPTPPSDVLGDTRHLQIAPTMPPVDVSKYLPDPNEPPITSFYSPVEARKASDQRSDGPYDMIGSHEPGYPKPIDRPMYPYGNQDYWFPHDAEVERWGDLLELPHVMPGWYGGFSATAIKSSVTSLMNSGDLLEAVFPGDPVAIGAAPLNWNASPELTLGYRFEHGLGEVEFSYRYLHADGRTGLPGFDPGGAATLFSTIRGHTLDLDYCFFEFNSESTAAGVPFLKIPGRQGLGRPLLPGVFANPLEARFIFGGRGSNLIYCLHDGSKTLAFRRIL